MESGRRLVQAPLPPARGQGACHPSQGHCNCLHGWEDSRTLPTAVGGRDKIMPTTDGSYHRYRHQHEGHSPEMTSSVPVIDRQGRWGPERVSTGTLGSGLDSSACCVAFGGPHTLSGCLALLAVQWPPEPAPPLHVAHSWLDTTMEAEAQQASLPARGEWEPTWAGGCGSPSLDHTWGHTSPCLGHTCSWPGGSLSVPDPLSPQEGGEAPSWAQRPCRP